jgi:hypothetical protein
LHPSSFTYAELQQQALDLTAKGKAVSMLVSNFFKIEKPHVFYEKV